MADFTFRHMSQVSIITKVIFMGMLTGCDAFHRLFHGLLLTNVIHLTRPTIGPILNMQCIKVQDRLFSFFLFFLKFSFL